MPWAAVLPAYANAHHPTMPFRSCNLLPPPALRTSNPARRVGLALAGVSMILWPV